MREYMRRGGTLWINDSSASDYEKFDEAFRPQVGALIPGGELERLPLEHDFFSACYDLRNGFKGFRIPPGDKYRQDEGGFFFHGGRSDDMIKAGGIWVSPVEVEGALVAHPSVLECAVVGTTDADGLVGTSTTVVKVRDPADLVAPVVDFADGACAVGLGVAGPGDLLTGDRTRVMH